MARTPKYLAAEQEMRRRIAAGDWAIGQRLGNEFELAAEFGVSQGTMRRALITLETEGHLARKPGRGTIVAEPNGQAAPSGTAEVKGPTGDGADFELHRARLTSRRPSDEEAERLGPGKIHHLERLLKRGATRSAIEVITIPVALVPEIDEDGPTDLATFLSAHGVTAAITTTASARLTSMGESVTLSCDRNTALLVVESLALGADGTHVAHQTLLIADPELSFG